MSGLLLGLAGAASDRSTHASGRTFAGIVYTRQGVAYEHSASSRAALRCHQAGGQELMALVIMLVEKHSRHSSAITTV